MRGPPIARPSEQTGRSTEELSIGEELSIHAALAGVTLSHLAIPVLNTENDLSGAMNLAALFLVVGIVLVYIGERFDTYEIGLRIVRTLSTVLFLYLLVNSTNGLLSIAGLDLSANRASLVSLVVVIIIAGVLTKLRGLQGLISDRGVGREVERNSDWALRGRLSTPVFFSILFCVLFIGYLYFAITRYAAPAFAGFLTSWAGIYISGQVFLRKKQFSPDYNAGANAPTIITLTTIIFMTVFVDDGWVSEIATELGIVL